MHTRTISARPTGIWLRFSSMLVIAAAVIATGATTRAEQDSKNPTTVVFVCLHGSVKSQMAAAHFNRIAKERGLPVVALSRGIAVDNAVPTGIRRGLAGDGLIPPSDVPVALTSEEATAAAKIFAFDEVPAEMRGPADVTYWSDVPPATKDYASARDAIVRHLEEVVSSMTPDH
jgi:protein-tyrosine-phosphatase